MKKYSIIYADPPWRYRDRREGHGGVIDEYPTMDDESIKRLPIEVMANNDCILFLWVTSPMLDVGIEVIKAWGFQFKTIGFVWSKRTKNNKPLHIGMGNYTMPNIELCLIGIRGQPKRICNNVPQLVEAIRTIHSKKPDEVRDRIVKLYGDIPRVELFTREKHEGWDNWGNEIKSDIELEHGCQDCKYYKACRRHRGICNMWEKA